MPQPRTPPEPEKQPLALPSTLRYTYLSNHNLGDLADKEIHLLEGQMNDCLQGIQTAIAYKSLLYWTKVRRAGSYWNKLRSFGKIQTTDDRLMKHI